ncbi:hypothetical protein KIK84_07250 [Curvibacter sp. CHRR-16]|uniref:hypothetical protein n=1 Tax=Curvibacter sp. CHRR-16 TaxID=2835872 RepID=UPI001BDAE542|nr:hypothetical protein [Curvibacter sp. CHRR-16]MBT0570115.1 hypothetical protein [Curvibacter sp. CHRR-16]
MTDNQEKINFVGQFLDVFNNLRNLCVNFLKQNPHFFEQLALFLDNLPKLLRDIWGKAAEYGWYINGCTPASVQEVMLQKVDQATLDREMVEHLERDWDSVVEGILSACPERREILECAFQLHTEGCYIAAIPLMFAQADGICEEGFTAHLFRGYKNLETDLDNLAGMHSSLDIWLKTLGLKTQLTQHSSNDSLEQKALAPNRHGVMHGSSKHLDYGTKINSLKAFSLLAFVVLIGEKIKAQKYEVSKSNL